MPTYSTDEVPSKWPKDYWPLWYRLPPGVGKARVLGWVKDYFTHVKLQGYVRVDKDRMLRLLAQPGFITIKWAEGEDKVHVRNWVKEAECMEFRDGNPIYYRPGINDLFIINENPYRKLPCRGKVLDLGAHIGTFARDALDRGADKVVCYEPEPVNYRLLKKNVSDMPVTIHRAAVDNHDTEAVLYLSWTNQGAGSGGNSLYRHTRADRPPVTVKVRAFLDVLEEEQPQVLKADIKDAETRLAWEAIPDCLEAIALEADVKFLHRLDKVFKRMGFTTVALPNITKFKRKVAIWTR